MRRLTDILDGVQGLVAAEAARMSLEEEVNQSVSRAVSLAEAADAAAAARRPEEDGPDSDRARPAGPARAGDGRQRLRRTAARRGRPAAVPGRPGLTSRLGPPIPDEPTRSTGRPPAGPSDPRRRRWAPGTAAARTGAGPQDMAPRQPVPMPSGHPVTGLGDPFGDRDPGRGNGLIDPDEPTEGLRLLQ